MHQYKRRFCYNGCFERHYGFCYTIFAHAYVVELADAEGEEGAGDAYLFIGRLVSTHVSRIQRQKH